MRLTVVLIYALVGAAGAMLLLFLSSMFGVHISVFYSEKIYSTGFFLIAALTVSLCCAMAMERHRLEKLMRSGLWCAGIAFAGALVFTWLDNVLPFEEVFARLYIWPVLWACLMALLGLLYLPNPPSKRWARSRRITAALFIVLAAHICLAVTLYPFSETGWGEKNYEWARSYDAFTLRFGWCIALLAGASLLCTFLFLWLAPRQAGEEGLPYWVQCPRCQSEQTLKTGKDHCSQCGLGISVEAL